MKKKQNILIVRNNPRNLEVSNLHNLEIFFTNELKKHHNIKVHDLYDENFFPRIDREFLAFILQPRLDGPSHLVKKYEKKIQIAKDFAKADTIIIVSPYWTGLFPSALKDWFDLLPVENITIKINPNGKSQSGISSNKKAIILQTQGDTKSRNTINNSGFTWIQDVLNYYGVENKRCRHLLATSSYTKKFNSRIVKGQIINTIKDFINND